MAATVTINDSLLQAIDADLRKVEAIHRAAPVTRGMRDAANIVKDRTASKLPRPGYPGDKPGKPSLRSALRIKVVHYDNNGRVVGMAGYSHEAGGQHGHLAEEGHRIVTGGSLPRKTASRSSKRPRKPNAGMGTASGYVPGRHDLQHASEETTQAQFAALESGIKQAMAGK